MGPLSDHPKGKGPLTAPIALKVSVYPLPVKSALAKSIFCTTTTAVLLTYPVAEAVKVTEESASTTSSNGA